MKLITFTRAIGVAGVLTLMHGSGALAATGGEATPLHLSGPTSVAHSAGAGSSILHTILALIIVIAVIYGVAWVLRRIRRDGSARASGTGLHSLATLPLGAGRSLALVRAGTDVLLLGVAEHSVTSIRRYTEAEALEAGLDVKSEEVAWLDEQEKTPSRFADLLRRLTVRS